MNDIHVYSIWTYEKINCATINIAKSWPIKFVMYLICHGSNWGSSYGLDSFTRSRRTNCVTTYELAPSMVEDQVGANILME
jgi:hypothetical protein